MAANNKEFVGVQDNEDFEDEEAEESGPGFVDYAYEKSDDEQCLLEKDDKAFDNYFDHDDPDANLNVAEEEAKS